MKTKIAFLLTASLLAGTMVGGSYSAMAADTDAITETATVEVRQPVQAFYPLTDALEAEVKGIFSDFTMKETRIGAVVRLKNKLNGNVRVPDYELRVLTEDGTEYTLQPSTTNAKFIKPGANTELSYMAVIDRIDNMAIQELRWTDVDYYVYPKTETVLTSVPVANQVWDGSTMTIHDSAAIMAWGASFRIPSLLSPLEYTPVGFNKESTEAGNSFVVQLAVSNPSEQRETVPDFRLDGKTEGKTFAGSRVEKEAVVLEAGETKYIHFSIPTEQDTVLTSLNVLTLENFSPEGQQAITYPIGRLNLRLPATSVTGAPAYSWSMPMSFDAHNDLIHQSIQVSLAEFQMHENEEEGVKYVTAKFKLFNTSDRPLDVPVFQSDLVSSGNEYSGKRQSSTVDKILPNTGAVVNYSYILPQSDTGKDLTLEVEDAITAAPFKTTIAAYQVELQEQGDGTSFDVYPFRMRMTHGDISYIYNPDSQLYVYEGKFFFDITREKAIQVDANFSRLRLELYDNAGQLVGTAEKPFTGANRLVSGENNIRFNGTSEQFASPLTLKVFEVFAVEGGEAERLVGEIQKY